MRRIRTLWQVLDKAVLVVMCAVTLVPILWLVSMSLKQPLDIFAVPPKFVFTPTVANYVHPQIRTGILPRYINTVIVAIGTTIVCMFAGSLAAYPLAKWKFPGSTLVAYAILACRLVPPIAIVVPLFLIFRRVGLIDRHAGLIIAYSTFVLPYVVWLMRGYFREIPREIEECALVDGASQLQVFGRIVMPCSLPGLAATAAFCVILCWNEFLYALALTRSAASTVPVGMTTLLHDIDRGGVVWGPLAATGTLSILPMIALGWAIQKVLIRGLTMGAVRE